MEDRYLAAAGLLLSAIPAGLFAIKFRSGSALHLISGIDPAKVRDPAALSEFVGLLFWRWRVCWRWRPAPSRWYRNRCCRSSSVCWSAAASRSPSRS